jgi:hypothetical protein
MDHPPESHTPIFMMDLWRIHRFRVDVVASQAGVSEKTVLALLRYQPVARQEAQKVLDTLSTLYQQEYTLSTVSVPLIEEKSD